MPSELPSAVLNHHHGPRAIAAAAAAAAMPLPVSCQATRAAPASASSPPARAKISHSAGAAPPVSDSGVVSSTGSGFHDGPALVSSESRSTSLPHCSQAYGSKASAHGRRSDSAASARLAGMSQTRRGRGARASELAAGWAMSSGDDVEDHREQDDEDHQHRYGGDPHRPDRRRRALAHRPRARTLGRPHAGSGP